MARGITGYLELDRAISQAARRYGVPVAALAGIWAIESGRTFPNPYVNSSGYGGLFGTRDWNGSTQAQANLAASILRTGFDRYGDWASALSYYNAGNPTGGYHSVPGFDPSNPGAVAGPSVTRPGGSAAPQQPQGFAAMGYTTDTGWFSHAAGDVGRWFKSGGKWVFHIGGAVVEWGEAIVHFVMFFTDPKNWLRALEVVAGSILMLGAVAMLAVELVRKGDSTKSARSARSTVSAVQPALKRLGLMGKAAAKATKTAAKATSSSE